MTLIIKMVKLFFTTFKKNKLFIIHYGSESFQKDITNYYGLCESSVGFF
jgi:hypothetical protein